MQWTGNFSSDADAGMCAFSLLGVIEMGTCKMMEIGSTGYGDWGGHGG